MGLLLILPLLVSGYLVCLKHPGYYFRLHRFEGQLLYLQVAKLGFTCLAFSTLFSLAVFYTSKQPLYFAGHFIPTDYSHTLGEWLVKTEIATERNSVLWVFWIQVGLTSMVVPHFWARLFVNRRKKALKLNSEEKLKHFLILSLLEGTPLKSILRDSIEHQTPYLLTMSDRKVSKT